MLDGFHGYECVCSSGFTGQFCEKQNRMFNDLNECETGHHDCHKHATCINTFDGFQCKCDLGFYGNGRAYCLEIDECINGFHNCHSDADCINTDGSFECACKNGYFGDGKLCYDINECQVLGFSELSWSFRIVYLQILIILGMKLYIEFIIKNWIQSRWFSHMQREWILL